MQWFAYISLLIHSLTLSVGYSIWSLFFPQSLKASVNENDDKNNDLFKLKKCHNCWESLDLMWTGLYSQTEEETVKTGLQVSLHESNNSQQHYPLLMAEIQITLHFQLEGEPTNSRSLKYWWVRGDVWEKDLHHQIWAAFSLTSTSLIHAISTVQTKVKMNFHFTISPR